MTRVLVIPNRRPYNDLWLDGRIPFKTRVGFDRVFQAHYGQRVYLYNSTKLDRHVLEAHDWTNQHMTPSGHIVGTGILKPFVPVTKFEAEVFEIDLWNGRPNQGIYAAQFKLDLDRLQRIDPIRFAWPRGWIKYAFWENPDA